MSLKIIPDLRQETVKAKFEDIFLYFSINIFILSITIFFQLMEILLH